MSAQTDSHPPGKFYCPTCEKNFQSGDRCPTDGTRLVKLSTPVDPLIGRELDGRYSISEKLGQGGIGAVYRGSQHGLGREVAIKLVSSHLVSDAEVVKRFLREAKLASRLAHPNAVAVLDFGQTEDGLFYLVMELVTGRTLDAVIKAERVFKPERIVRIGTQVCDALEGAHALQIVHRDLKPANIMLLASGRDLVKVLDFGLAKSVAPDQTSTTMTNAGALLGTPAFMPPELALGQSCDGRADLYSLGVVLYLMGSGRLPFVSDSAHELIAMHGTDQAPAMTGVPPELAQVIDRMLRKDPRERYQTASENREALEAALEHRYTTPAAGVPVFGGPTNPSLGPFPATSSQFANLTPLPEGRTSARARSQSAMDRLVSGDTMEAHQAAAINDTTIHESKRPRPKWQLVAGGATLVVAVGIGMFALVGGAPKHDAPAPPPPAVITPAPVAKPAPEVITPPPPPPPAVVTTPIVPPPPEATVKPVPKPHPQGSYLHKNPTTTKSVTPPVITTPPKVDNTGSGSAKKALPF